MPLLAALASQSAIRAATFPLAQEAAVLMLSSVKTAGQFGC
jgi:hypothetical protein